VGTNENDHTNWRILSELIGLPQSCIHFIGPEVGGGFGARGEFYAEDFLIPFAAIPEPGRYEANFVPELILDLLAHRLKLDPADIRRRNLIPREEMPYYLGKHPFHYMVYDTGDFPAQFERALEQIEHEKLKATCAAAKKAGRAIGVGIGCFVETSGIGPWEYARVEIDNAGKVVLYSGCNSVGQGIATALSRIVADELQVPIDDIRVVHGDTAKVPYGNGSNASRSTVMAGASRKVKEKDSA